MSKVVGTMQIQRVLPPVRSPDLSDNREPLDRIRVLRLPLLGGLGLLSLLLVFSGCGNSPQTQAKSSAHEVARSFASSNAQIDLRFTPLPLATNQLLHVVVRADFPPGQRPILPEAPGSFGDLELREVRPVEESLDPDTRRTLTQAEWIYAPFLPGSFSFPALEFSSVAVAGEAEGIALATQPVEVVVESVLDPAEGASDKAPSLPDLEFPSAKVLAEAERRKSAPTADRPSSLPGLSWRGRSLLWSLLLLCGVVLAYWLRSHRTVEAPQMSVGSRSLERLRTLELDGQATPDALGGLVEDHLDALHSPPAANASGTALEMLVESVQTALDETRFSSTAKTPEVADSELVELVRRLFAATPR